MNTLAVIDAAEQVRDIIKATCPKPEDQQALWDWVKCAVNDVPFFYRDDADHPSLSARERNR